VVRHVSGHTHDQSLGTLGKLPGRTVLFYFDSETANDYNRVRNICFGGYVCWLQMTGVV
jgi:hypothetical protein